MSHEGLPYVVNTQQLVSTGQQLMTSKNLPLASKTFNRASHVDW